MKSYVDEPAIRPFEVRIADAVLVDLKQRIRQTRWPTEPAGQAWQFGADQGYMRRVARYWAESYDWRLAEARINAFDNYLIKIDDLDIHCIVEAGSGQNPRPLILTHGWPGSLIEFLDIIDPLAHPEKHGGDVGDAFTVIVPTLPGYGFSAPPPSPVTPRDVAHIWNALMRTLGHDVYYAQGGDWGGIISSWLAAEFPQNVKALHLNIVGLESPVPEGGPGEDEVNWQRRAERRRGPEAGYRGSAGDPASHPRLLPDGFSHRPGGLDTGEVSRLDRSRRGSRPAF